LRENQEPWDELLCFEFELFNSRNEPRFLKLQQRAVNGTISREDFVTEICRIEFDAAMATRASITTYKPSENDRAKSSFYSVILNCPTNVTEFVPYVRTLYNGWDRTADYKQQYDDLRNLGGQRGATGAHP
jgi:hypothetical protein